MTWHTSRDKYAESGARTILAAGCFVRMCRALRKLTLIALLTIGCVSHDRAALDSIDASISPPVQALAIRAAHTMRVRSGERSPTSHQTDVACGDGTRFITMIRMGGVDRIAARSRFVLRFLHVAATVLVTR